MVVFSGFTISVLRIPGGWPPEPPVFPPPAVPPLPLIVPAAPPVELAFVIVPAAAPALPPVAPLPPPGGSRPRISAQPAAAMDAAIAPAMNIAVEAVERQSPGALMYLSTLECHARGARAIRRRPVPELPAVIPAPAIRV